MSVKVVISSSERDLAALTKTADEHAATHSTTVSTTEEKQNIITKIDSTIEAEDKRIGEWSTRLKDLPEAKVGVQFLQSEQMAIALFRNSLIESKKVQEA